MDWWIFRLLLWLYLLWLYLGELLDRVGLRVDGDDGHDKEDGEADDLVGERARARVRPRVRASWLGLGVRQESR